MKIRNGFVSNSSSSSFCIYGVSVDKSSIMEEKTFMDFAKKEINVINQNDDDFEINDEDLNFDMINDILDAILNDFNLPGSYGPYDWNTAYIGRSWQGIKGKETADEFKENVQKNIEEFFKKYLPGIKPDECQTHQEAWHD